MNKRLPASVIDKSDARWHLDRKVPIALIASLFIQTGGIFWWGATTSARINALEEKAAVAAAQPERLTRVETKLESVQDGIAEIKAILRKEPPPQRRN